MLKKFAFVDINGVIGGGGSGIYDDAQTPDGSTIKERIEVLKTKYSTWIYHEEPAKDDIQPSAETMHVKSGKLVKWVKEEIEARRKIQQKNELKDQMILTQTEIDACDRITGIDMTGKKAEKQAILEKQKQEHELFEVVKA